MSSNYMAWTNKSAKEGEMFEGWIQASITCFNKMVTEIKAQRKTTEGGSLLEEEMQEEISRNRKMGGKHVLGEVKEAA